MYSNQSPQTAYQQFYNNMPSYPQNNQPLPDKQPMVEKYPLQIWVAARAGMSLTCAADLNVPGEFANGNAHRLFRIPYGHRLFGKGKRGCQYPG